MAAIDDLIDKIGSLLEANSNAIRRKEERIVITDDSKRRLGISKDETIIYIQNVPRRCILRDISFSGAKVILLGIEKFIKGKDSILRIHFDDPDEIILLEGHIVKTSPVENRAEIIYACLQFDELKVPTSYKIRINTYLTTIRKTILNAVQQEQNSGKDAQAPQQEQTVSQSAPQQESNAAQGSENVSAAGSQISDAVQNNDGNENSSVQGNDTKEETLPEMPDIPNSTD